MSKFWRIVVPSMFAMAPAAHADVSIRDVEVSALPELNIPGQAWERISVRNYYVFEGLDVPLISIRGMQKSWFLKDARLEEWTFPFPKTNLLYETIELPGGAVIGGPSGNHLRFIKPIGKDAFEPIPEAAGLYWNDHVEGSGVVFAKRSKDGPLLVLDGETFLPSPIPEKGYTQNGEFLPWYSEALDGYFTASAADIWFYRLDDPSWQLVKEDKPRSWAPSWGFYQRGSQDFLSPDDSLLKVISKNGNALTQYKVSDGYPNEKLRSLGGQWYQIGDSGEIVGWLGSWHRNLILAEDSEEVEARTPKFVRIPPNSNLPKALPNLRPLILLYDENSISYQYRFANMPGTDRLYFLHEDGFAYYSDGAVTVLPVEWLDTVGKLPHFFATNKALYVVARNGLYLLSQDDTLIEVLAPQEEVGFGLNDKVFDLGCDGQSIGFFGWKTGIYLLDPIGEADLIMQSQSPIRVYGTTADGRSILFSEKEGRLKLLSAEC